VLVSYVNLYKAMGGGWVITAEGLTTQAAQHSGDAAAQSAK
jgi:multidrug efflux system outer membrane protein